MKALPHPPTRRSRRGFALISVLWGVAVLSLIAAAVLSSTMAARRGSHAALERLQAEALAEAGINDAIVSLLAPQPGQMPRIDGTPYDFVFAETRIAVSIQDENGRIDLNNADGETLARLFTSVSVPQTEAAALSDRIQDWREPRIGKRVNGAIAEDYRAAGYGYGPRGKPFHTLDELKLVMGVSPDLFRKVAPSLTVYSHRGSVNRQTAPRGVLLVLDLGNAGAVDQLLITRSGRLIAGMSLADWVFTIRAEVKMSSGGIYRREAVIRLTGNDADPYWVHAWREVWVE